MNPGISKQQAEYLRAGLTGWATVKGRAEIVRVIRMANRGLIKRTASANDTCQIRTTDRGAKLLRESGH